jgi:hypothetical protein
VRRLRRLRRLLALGRLAERVLLREDEIYWKAVGPGAGRLTLRVDVFIECSPAQARLINEVLDRRER